MDVKKCTNKSVMYYVQSGCFAHKSVLFVHFDILLAVVVAVPYTP